MNNIKKVYSVRKSTNNLDCYEICEYTSVNKKGFKSVYLIFNDSYYKHKISDKFIDNNDYWFLLDNYLTKLNIQKELDKQKIYGTVKKMRRI